VGVITRFLRCHGSPSKPELASSRIISRPPLWTERFRLGVKRPRSAGECQVLCWRTSRLRISSSSCIHAFWRGLAAVRAGPPQPDCWPAAPPGRRWPPARSARTQRLKPLDQRLSSVRLRHLPPAQTAATSRCAPQGVDGNGDRCADIAVSFELARLCKMQSRLARTTAQPLITALLAWRRI
jgi:hypothetical protein